MYTTEPQGRQPIVQLAIPLSLQALCNTEEKKSKYSSNAKLTGRKDQGKRLSRCLVLTITLTGDIYEYELFTKDTLIFVDRDRYKPQWGVPSVELDIAPIEIHPHQPSFRK